jgi:hypothetical protein
MFCLNSANLSREKLLSHVGKDLLNIKLPQAPNDRLGNSKMGQIGGEG